MGRGGMLVGLILALLCDDACTTADGKLDMHGVFNDLFAPGFPARREKMVFVAGIEWDRKDSGRFQFKIDLVDPSGRPALTLEGHTDVDERPEDRPPARTWLIMPLENVVFTRPGCYRFTIRIKGTELTGPALHVFPSDDGLGTGDRKL
jgi:hypothetical protein